VCVRCSASSYRPNTVSVGESQTKFQIWDTAGQEKYAAVPPALYRSAAVAVIVYDITQRSSFDNARVWFAKVKQSALPDVVIAVCGNKTDLDSARVSLGESRMSAHTRMHIACGPITCYPG
jgi:Ras-related protein Rab-5C